METDARVQARSSKLSDKRGIQSIEVGFALIEVLVARRCKLPLKTLSAEAGMSPSKASLYLVSFMRLGLVVQDKRTGHYGLGVAAIRIGMAAIEQLNVVDLAQPHMEAVQAGFEVAVSLSIWGNLGPTIIHKLDARLQAPLAVKVGFVLPVLTTATGRLFLAFLPQAQWQPLADREGAVAPAALKAAMRAANGIRADGLAMTNNQMQPGFYGISAPIFGPDATIVAAMTALGASPFDDPTLARRLGQQLREATAAISRDLGHQPAAAA